MTEFVRTDDRHFDQLDDWPYAPNYHQWKDLRVHYVDVGPPDGPVALLLHGMPDWAYLYRTMIPGLVEAGYRCIAPDHLGFGRSDKPTDPNWYSIARHTEVLTSLVTALDLRKMTLVCQDWGGPTGLAQAAMMPERFSRLIIMNTWLHQPDWEYSDGIKNWIAGWHPGGLFDVEKPNLALLLVMSAGLIDPATALASITGEAPALEGEAANMYAGFAAPFRDLPDEGFNGPRRFPLSIPANDPDSGNAAAQTMHYQRLLDLDIPAQFIWGCQDHIFTEAWGRAWAEAMDAPFYALDNAGHFPQLTHGPEIVECIVGGTP